MYGTEHMASQYSVYNTTLYMLIEVTTTSVFCLWLLFISRDAIALMIFYYGLGVFCTIIAITYLNESP